MAELRPMLAAEADLGKIQYPIILQPKYDGIRCLLGLSGQGLSRTLKPIPNHFIQRKLSFLNEMMGNSALGLDGELVTYTNGVMDKLHVVQSKVMKSSGESEFKFHIFDDYTLKSLPYESRHRMIHRRLTIDILDVGYYNLVKMVVAEDEESLNAYEEELVGDGWEGMIGRKPGSFYKYGRSTAKEGTLLKFKRFQDAEAEIVGFEELEHNLNEQTKDERGLSKRSSHKAGKLEGSTLGALQLRWGSVFFKVGTGFDEETRQEIWDNREKYLGKTVTFKYKDVGPNGKPLIASFKSFRTDIVAKAGGVRAEPEEGQVQGSLF